MLKPDMIPPPAGHLVAPNAGGGFRRFSSSKAQDRAATAGDTREGFAYLRAYSNLSENAGHTYA